MGVKKCLDRQIDEGLRISECELEGATLLKSKKTILVFQEQCCLYLGSNEGRQLSLLCTYHLIL